MRNVKIGEFQHHDFFKAKPSPSRRAMAKHSIYRTTNLRKLKACVTIMLCFGNQYTDMLCNLVINWIFNTNSGRHQFSSIFSSKRCQLFGGNNNVSVAYNICHRPTAKMNGKWKWKSNHLFIQPWQNSDIHLSYASACIE